MPHHETETAPADRASLLIRRHQATARKRRMTTTIVVVVAVLVSIFGAQKLLSLRGGGSTDIAAPAHSTANYGFRLTPAILTGKKQTDPPITIALYEDFLCPSCRAFEESASALLEDVVKSAQAVVEYRPFTFLLGASTNRYTQRASNAAACVADTAGVAKYVKFHDLLYADQPAEGGAGHTDTELIALAKKAGADDTTECIKDEKFAAWVTQALKHGRTMGVSKTPTVVLNGKIIEVEGADGDAVAPSPDDLERAIAQLNS